MGCDWWGEPYPRVSWYSTHATEVVEIVRIISGMYFYFSADVKKPSSFESGFLVFGA